jgi:DNA-binding NtrC family response regulator
MKRKKSFEKTLVSGSGEGDSLRHNVFALVAHELPEPCESLKPVLRRLGVDAFSVHRCAEALRLIEQTHPHLIFTDGQLPDGNWMDLVNLAENAAIPICVILVGPEKDPETLQAAIRHGAFSFISPPFDDRTVSRQINQAIALVRARRERRWGAAVA